jgi:hypothetical protein
VNVKEVDCARIEEHDLVALYLAGKVPESEAEAFEKHYFSCERCWQDVRRAGEIRAALGKPVLVPLPEPRRHGRERLRPTGGLRWLAAAAALALATLGIWQVTRRGAPPAEPILRGGMVGSLPLQIEAGPGRRITLGWPSHPDAQVYVVQVFTSDGVSAWRRETQETRVSLEASELPPPRPGISFLASVEALDATRQVVAKSELKRLPRP